MEELLRLHRAFNAALRSCEQSKDKQKQLDAVRELARVDRKFAKVAKTISRKHKETHPKLLDVLGKMVDETYELSHDPVLSKFNRRIEARER
ncbi:MAG: hypothetical protein ACLP9D_10465 [Candidatus Bathyarchaeia archaeon]